MTRMADSWSVLTSLFPADWSRMASQFGAVVRFRRFPSPNELLRTLLLHVACGYSLRETVARARLARWTDISDVSLLKRLRKSEEWLRALCIGLLRENGTYHIREGAHQSVRIVDGTVVKEPGKTGGQWRILYCLKLPSLRCDFFDVRATVGMGNGESLNRLPVARRDLIIADAGYCSVAGIEYVNQRGADILDRINPQSFVAYSSRGTRISLLPLLRALPKEGHYGEWKIVLHGQGSLIVGRLCAVRKNILSIQQAHRRLRRRASKKQMTTRPGTFELAKYVLVFTTQCNGSVAEILESYRLRWQIELMFKRLKSLAQMGHVPKHDAGSARAWLYGKLFISLLVQKLISIGRVISPRFALSRQARIPSPWREFNFAYHQIQQAIEPHLCLQETLSSWNDVSVALGEHPRNRTPQLSKRAHAEHY